MASRMDRYNEDSKIEKSRSEKNQTLYENLNNNASYVKFEETKLPGAIKLDEPPITVNKRESYQLSKKRVLFTEDDKIAKIAPLIEDKHTENRIYDINEVLSAVKEKKQDEEGSVKRKLKNIEYEILTDLSEDKVKDFKNRKKEVIKEAKEKEETKENKNDSDILDDLMPTKLDETLISETLKDELNDTYSTEDLDKFLERTAEEEYHSKEVGEIDDSFYTRSMDLSDSDLVRKTKKQDNSFKEIVEKPKKTKIILIVSISIVIVLLIVAAYIIIK